MSQPLPGQTSLSTALPISLSQSPAVRPAEAKLEAFRAQNSPEISQATMLSMIASGKETLQRLRTAAETAGTNELWLESLTHMGLKQQDAVNVIWALYEKIAEKENLFVSGSIRLNGTDSLTGAKMEDFFRACGQAKQSLDPKTQKTSLTGGLAYHRISTHLKEHLTAANPQYGLDLRNCTIDGRPSGLPAKKRTLLFGKQPDGTLFIKPEEHGCPPLKQAGVKKSENLIECIGHAVDFLKTRTYYKTLRNLGIVLLAIDPLKLLGYVLTRTLLPSHVFATQPASKEQSRKEKVSKETLDEFKAFLRATTLSLADQEKALQEGETYGRYRMEQIADSIKTTNQLPPPIKQEKTIPPKKSRTLPAPEMHPIVQKGSEQASSTKGKGVPTAYELLKLLQAAQLQDKHFMPETLKSKNIMLKGDEVVVEL